MMMIPTKTNDDNDDNVDGSDDDYDNIDDDDYKDDNDVNDDNDDDDDNDNDTPVVGSCHNHFCRRVAGASVDSKINAAAMKEGHGSPAAVAAQRPLFSSPLTGPHAT